MNKTTAAIMGLILLSLNVAHASVSTCSSNSPYYHCWNADVTASFTDTLTGNSLATTAVCNSGTATFSSGKATFTGVKTGTDNKLTCTYSSTGYSDLSQVYTLASSSSDLSVTNPVFRLPGTEYVTLGLSGTDQSKSLSVTGAGATSTSCTSTKCPVLASSAFTIHAVSTDFSGSYSSAGTSSDIDSSTATISMTRLGRTVTMTVKDASSNPLSATLTPGTNTRSCTGSSCTVESGLAYSISVSATGYVTKTYTGTTSTDTSGTVTLDLAPSTFTLTVNDDAGNPVILGTVNVNGVNAALASANPAVYNIVPATLNINYYRTTGYKSNSTSIPFTNAFTLVVNRIGRVNFGINDSKNTQLTPDYLFGVYTDGRASECNKTLKYCNITYYPDNITIIKNGYVSQTVNGLIATSGTVNVTMPETLTVNITDDALNAVTSGRIVVNDSSSGLTISSKNISSGVVQYIFNITTPATVNVYYIPGINYSNIASNTSLVLTNASQTNVLLNTTRVWNTPVNLTNSLGTKLNVSNALLDGISISCPNNSCWIDRNSHALNVSSNGYTNASFSVPSGNNGATLSAVLNETLMLNLTDDAGGIVKSGKIIVNNSIDSLTLYSKNITSSNSQNIFYIPASSITVNVYYVPGTNYSTLGLATGVSLNDALQTNTTINTTRVWSTLVNATGIYGDKINTSVALDNNPINCSSNYCWIDRNSHLMNLSMPGYLNSSAIINAGNNGSPINLLMNTTLHVNMFNTTVTNVSVTGQVAIINSTAILYSTGLVNGSAWIPVKPSWNNNMLNVTFTSNDFVSVNLTIPATVINDYAYTEYNMTTTTLNKLIINASDIYTSKPLSVNALGWIGNNTYCTGSSTCAFQMFTIPSSVMLNVSSPGYYLNLTNQSTNTALVNILLNPRAVVFVNTEANISVFNNSLSGKSLLNTTTTNRLASLPLDTNVTFMLNITAKDFDPLIAGPYTTSDTPTIIGSTSSPLRLNLSTPLIIANPPVVNNLTYAPLNPYTNDSVIINAFASTNSGGNITQCKYRVDNGNNYTMQGNYTSSSVNASSNLGNLTSGSHTIYASCTDNVKGWGSEKSVTLSVTQAETYQAPVDNNTEDSNNITNNNTDQLSILSSLKDNYDLLVKIGSPDPTLASAISNAESKLNTDGFNAAVTNAQNLMPLIVQKQSISVKTTDASSPELIAEQVATKENRQYSSIIPVMFDKHASIYQLDGNYKTVISLKVYSDNDNPNAVIADSNPGSSSASTSINTVNGSITYFVGLNKGENVFEYVIDGAVNETSKPIEFTISSSNSLSNIANAVTGFTIGVPGLFEVPVVYVGAGIIVLLILIKLLI